MTTYYSEDDLDALARDEFEGKCCNHGHKFNVAHKGIRVGKGCTSLVVTGIADCDTGCGRDINIAL
jgi:hypothetical protein